MKSNMVLVIIGAAMIFGGVIIACVSNNKDVVISGGAIAWLGMPVVWLGGSR